MYTLSEISTELNIPKTTAREWLKPFFGREPSDTKNNTALRFNEKERQLAWQVRFYRQSSINNRDESVFLKDDILNIISDDECDIFDKFNRRNEKAAALTNQRERCERLFSFAEETGITPCSFRFGFPGIKSLNYSDIVSALYVFSTDYFSIADKLQNCSISDADSEEISVYIGCISRFKEMGHTPDSKMVQEAVASIHKTLSKAFGDSSILMDNYLPIIAPGSLLSITIDKRFASGTSDFIYEALVFYCNNEGEKCFNSEHLPVYEKLYNLAEKGFLPKSAKVQSAIEELYTLYAKVFKNFGKDVLLLFEFQGISYAHFEQYGFDCDRDCIEFFHFLSKAIGCFCGNYKKAGET